MQRKAIYLVAAAVAGLCLVQSKTTPAAAMRCSGEQKTCYSNCLKILDSVSNTACLANCRQRNAACMQTGCWDNGSVRYCDLLKR
jgi:hypothetical protein